jgi:hypothetical protein
MRPTEFTVSLNCMLMTRYELWEMGVPNTEKLDRNVDGKGFLERIRLFPPKLGDVRKHLVCERDLLVVACG